MRGDLAPLRRARPKRADQLLEPLQTALTPAQRKLTGRDIAQAVLDGEADAREAADLLLARAVRKIL